MGELERTKLSGKEYYSLRAIMGVVSVLETCDNDLKNRLSKIPGAWRDLKLIEALSSKLVDNVLKTILPNKMLQIKEELDHVRLEVSVLPDYTGKHKEKFTYVPTSNLEWLENQVIDMNCAFCDKTCEQSKKCPVRKNIEALYHYDFPERKGCPIASKTIK